MSTTALAPAVDQVLDNAKQSRPSAIESALIQGDLAKLSEQQRVEYYLTICRSLGLNPTTKPFEYITLNSKLTLYARRDCTDQLRRRDRISIRIASREVMEGIYVVTAEASTPDGRMDTSIGAVALEGTKGEARANAMMRAETKSKRRVTLSICGLGFLDESEVADIPPAEEPQPPPLTAAQRVAQLDQTLAERKLCSPGHFTSHVRQLLAPKYGDDLDQWPNAAKGDVTAASVAYKATCEERQKLAHVNDIAALDRERERVGYSWADIFLNAGLKGDRARKENLTSAYVAECMALMKPMDTVKN